MTASEPFNSLCKQVKRIHLMLRTVMPSKPSEPAKSISLLGWATSAILRACGVPNTKLTGSSKITAVGRLETRGAEHRVQDLICPLDVQTGKGCIDSRIHTEYLMGMSSTGLSRSATKETNRPTHATVHPYRASSCRDNLEQPVAPRRQGPWVPSPSHTGVFGAPPFICAIPTLVREYLFSWQLGHFLFGLPAREFRVSSLCHLVGSWVDALPFGPPLPGDRRPLTHSPRREVASGPATRGVPTKRWCCFGSDTLPSRTVALCTQSYPAAFEVTLFLRGTVSDNILDWTLQLNNVVVHP